MPKRERLLAVWVSYNIWKILNLESEFFETSGGSEFLGESEFFGGLCFQETQGVWVFETSRAASFSGVGVFDTPRGSEFSIHPGGLCSRYTQGSEFYGGSVFSIHPGGLSFSGSLSFRYTQGSEFFGGSVFSIHPGIWVFWGVCVFDTPRGSVFSIHPGSKFFG